MVILIANYHLTLFEGVVDMNSSAQLRWCTVEPKPAHLRQSPVQDLLKTNRPPTPREAALTLNTIHHIVEDIALVDEEISKARAVVENLLAKRKALETYRKAHTGIISALRRIPPEILSHIFMFFIPSPPSKPHDSNAPVLLEQICIWWRDVAWSTPQLWSSIHLELTTQTIERDAPAAKAWFSRSGRYPLSIILGSRSDTFAPNAHIVLNDVLRHCDRWRDVALILPYTLLTHFSVVKGRLPLLENLLISNTEFSWPYSMDAFQQAPRLRRMELELNDAIPRSIEVPWHALTKLITGSECSEPSVVLELLSKCSNLEECELTCVRDWDDFPSRDEPVQLLHLRTLNIGTDRISSYIFDNLTLPALREIHVMLHPDELYEYDEDGGAFWECRPNFISLLSRSRCSIQILSLECIPDVGLSERDIIACLRATPALVELRIRDGAALALTRQVLRRLTHRPEKDKTVVCLVPKLQALKIDCFQHAFLDELFAKMVESRWILKGVPGASLARLQNVEIDIIVDGDDLDDDDFEDELMDENQFDPNTMQETLRVLRIFREDGMEVSVTEEDDDGDVTNWL